MNITFTVPGVPVPWARARQNCIVRFTDPKVAAYKLDDEKLRLLSFEDRWHFAVERCEEFAYEPGTDEQELRYLPLPLAGERANANRKPLLRAGLHAGAQRGRAGSAVAGAGVGRPVWAGWPTLEDA